MKKIFRTLIAVMLVCLLIVPTGTTALAAEKEIVLRVHNWQDYINEEYCLDDEATNFETWYYTKTGKKIRVEYTTFGTNEVLYNDMKIGKGDYDLVCPSDYMIEKMMNEGLIQPIDPDNIPNYKSYATPLFQTEFQKIGTPERNVSQYAVGYMWGTLGFVYNPEKVDEQDVKTWLVAWNEKYKGKVTIKDSVRDSYFLGVGAAMCDELLALRTEYLKDPVGNAAAYSAALNAIFNDTSPEMLAAVEKALREQNKMLYGYELDSGKTDMISGKIDLNFCWSGDAVYTMDQAEYGPEDLSEKELENYKPRYFNYAVPEEGSNIWFDGWVIPATVTPERKAAAEAFLDYLSDPQTAAANMEYIGYTSAIAGDAIFELINDWYGADEGYEVDLSYFFGDTLSAEYLTDGRAIVITEELGRQFSAQYPDEEVIKRSVVMRDFGNQNDALLDMWLRVKGNALPFWAILVIVCGTVGAIVIGWVLIKLTKAGKFERKRRPPKGYTLIKKG